MRNKHGGRSVTLDEPFHGNVGFSVTRAPSGSAVHLVVSIERSWDADILIGRTQATALADSLGGTDVHIATGETVDGAATVFVTKGDRLAIVIPDERISEVLILGADARTIAEHLQTAAREDP
jgi:hypothetical protein